MMHKPIKKLFFKPTYCAYCCKKIRILVKKSVKCQACKQSYHADCYEKTNCKNIEVFWEGYLSYKIGNNNKAIVNFWRLTQDFIIIYKNDKLEKKIQKIPLNDVNNIVNDELLIKSYLKQFKCRLHFRVKNVEFHCGIETNDEKMDNLMAEFFETFHFVNQFRNNKNIFSSINAPNYKKNNIMSDYDIDEKPCIIGSGSFGSVFCAVDRNTQKSVAVKKIQLKNHSFYQVEALFLSNLNHQNLVQLIDLYHDENNVFYVMERLELNLLEFILENPLQRLSEDVSKLISYQVFVALSFLHSREIAHCDMKPENILLVKNTKYPQVKICDFGFSKVISNNDFRRAKNLNNNGTKIYNAPELNQRNRLYNKNVDIWAVGVTLYSCLSGEFPFNDSSSICSILQQKKSLFVSNLWKDISANAIDLLENKLLVVKIKSRCSVETILKHDWFQKDKLFMNFLQFLQKN